MSWLSPKDSAGCREAVSWVFYLTNMRKKQILSQMLNRMSSLATKFEINKWRLFVIIVVVAIIFLSSQALIIKQVHRQTQQFIHHNYNSKYKKQWLCQTACQRVVAKTRLVNGENSIIVFGPWSCPTYWHDQMTPYGNQAFSNKAYVHKEKKANFINNRILKYVTENARACNSLRPWEIDLIYNE